MRSSADPYNIGCWVFCLVPETLHTTKLHTWRNALSGRARNHVLQRAEWRTIRGRRPVDVAALPGVLEQQAAALHAKLAAVFERHARQLGARFACGHQRARAKLGAGIVDTIGPLRRAVSGGNHDVGRQIDDARTHVNVVRAARVKPAARRVRARERRRKCDRAPAHLCDVALLRVRVVVR